MDLSIATVSDAIALNLSEYEYHIICNHLGRIPNLLELEIYALLWTEHASYKSSVKWIKTLPSSGSHVIVEALSENAGVADLGDGVACVVKIESHNHPCSVQPKLGTFTGLRVVNRDIFSMGAKPIAYLSSLRFGDRKNRDAAHWFFAEVMSGLHAFEKSFGVPVLGGDVCFSADFNTNPVVNNMAVGVVATNKIIRCGASKVDSIILLIGSGTGRDGINSDSFVSDYISENISDTKKLSFNQMTNSRIENALYEAVELLNDKGVVLALQTVGSQGIIGAAAEMAAKGETQITLHIDKVPTYEKGITPREILISQTWGRMLINIDPSMLTMVMELLKPLNLVFSVIGLVEEGCDLVCKYNDDIIISLPANSVGFGGVAPINILPFNEPKSSNLRKIDIDLYPEPDHYPNVIKALINNPNMIGKLAFYRSGIFSEIKGSSLNLDFPGDAYLVDLEESKKTVAMAIEGNPYYTDADSYIGTQIAFFALAKNIACSGAKPLAAVDCLNFGSPYNRDVYGEFISSVKALTEVSKRINIPIVAGNVSFFNQRSEEGKLVPIATSPIIGMVGILNNRNHHSTISFKHKGDMIFLLGKSRQCINSSEYAIRVLGIEKSAVPSFSFDEEIELLNVINQLNKRELTRSMHNVGKGGLFFNLLESALPLQFGFDIISDAEIRKDAFLFGEGQGRVVVSVAPEKEDQFVDFMMEMKFPFFSLGLVTKNEISVDDEPFGEISTYAAKIRNSLVKWENGEIN